MRVQNDVHGNNNNNNQAVNQNNNQNNENRAAAENPAANENPPAAAPQPGPLLNAGGAAGANAAPESTVPQTEPSVPRIPERPSPVAITLLAIRTFFLSLVPEHHTLWTTRSPISEAFPSVSIFYPVALFRARNVLLNYLYYYRFKQ